MKISVGGNIHDEREAVVSVYDHGFLYGIGLFETFRTYGGSPFLLKEHLLRLEQGCSILGIPYQSDQIMIEKELTHLLQVNGLSDAYIRYTVTAGQDVLGLPGARYEKPVVIIYVKELPGYDEHLYSAGKPAQLLKTRRNTPEGEIRLKSLHYMNNIIAKRELGNYPWAQGAEGLFLNESGHVAEGIVSNVFFVKDRICFTPAVSTGILPGITRKYVMRLAGELDIEFREGLYGWEQLIEADEVFVTNSIQEIVPVTSLFDTSGSCKAVGDGLVGTITQRLISYYREQIRSRQSR